VTTIMTEHPGGFIVGIDTHADTNMAVVIDDIGRERAIREFPTTAQGHRELYTWATSFGPLIASGIEGTGSWGAGITRFLQSRTVRCVEVNRVNRQHRRRHGKSDPADALAAARSVLSGDATAVPRDRTGTMESLRVTRLACRSAVKARTQAMNQIRAVISTAPDELRCQVTGLTMTPMVPKMIGWRPNGFDDINTTKRVLRALARRGEALNDEIAVHDEAQQHLVALVAPPELLASKGIGPNTATDLLLAFGSNPERVTSEAKFAALCGVSPIDCSSGRQHRHRLNRGGDRQANNALWRIVLVRLSSDQTTRGYMNRQLANGKTKPEAIRQLKRYTARRIWRILHQNPPT
jgi:transposase